MNINIELVLVIAGPFLGGGMMFAVMTALAPNRFEMQWALPLGVPKEPLPSLVERLNTTQGHFIRPARPASEDGTTSHQTAEYCTYLATDYSTRDWEIVRLIHHVQPPGCMQRSVLEACFVGEDRVAAVLEYAVQGDEEGFVLTRHYPSPHPVPAAAYRDPEFGNIVQETVYDTGNERSIWIRDDSEIEGEEWYSRNELVLELDDLPQEATYA